MIGVVGFEGVVMDDGGARNGYSNPGTGLCMIKRCSVHSKKEARTTPAEKPRADQNNKFISINFLTSLLAVQKIEI